MGDEGTLDAASRLNGVEVAEATSGLCRTLKALDDHSKRIQSRHGISGPQLGALWEVHQNHGLTVSQGARRMYLHPSTFSGIADRLEAKGLARRIRDGRDHRVVHLEITDKGLALLKIAPRPIRQQIMETLQELPEPELRAFVQGMSALAEAIEDEGRSLVSSASQHHR
jgi:DNA-binding MarR family transcriptional regulator